MRERLRKLLLSNPNTLMYHGVPANGRQGLNAVRFEKQVLFLKRHFQLLAAADLWVKRPRESRPAVVLSFDDGFRNNAEVVAPILRKHCVPALFFVSSRHAEAGKYLWFAYFQALGLHFKWKSFSLNGKWMDMSAGRRRATVSRLAQQLGELKPYPAAMYRVIEEELPPFEEFVSSELRRDKYEGMTAGDIEELGADPLFTVGVHTVDHPFLSRCERSEVMYQITANKNWLQGLSKKPCDMIAYPLGDYDRRTIECCREAGLTRGFAVVPKLNTETEWEAPRIGIYSRSLTILGVKALWGWTPALDRLPRLHGLRSLLVDEECAPPATSEFPYRPGTSAS